MNIFTYLRPPSKAPKDSKQPWFSHLPFGKNKLSSMVKEMCKAAGVEGNKTNHSLRCCGVTSLYKSNVPEKLIQERSGHCSLTALCAYERPTAEQILEASKVCISPSNRKAVKSKGSIFSAESNERSSSNCCHPAETLVTQKLFLKNWKILTWMSFSKTVEQEVTKAGSH